MIPALLLLVAAQGQPAAPPEDVVVTARRAEGLKRLRMTTRVDRRTGVTRCIFKRRSGDPAPDAAVCNAVLACVPTVRTIAEMRACIAPTMDRLVASGIPWQATTPGARR